MNQQERPTIGAILAGGKSTRMGQDKALLSIDHDTMLFRTREILAKCSVDEVVINRNDGNSGHISDLFPDKGPLSGIHSVLSAYSECHVLLVPVDLPLLEPTTLQTLIDAGQQAQSNACYNEQVLPLYLHYNAHHLSHLNTTFKHAVDKTDVSIRGFMKAFTCLKVAAVSQQALFNANTPPQWHKALDLAKEARTKKGK